jgi:hypothetical protein
VTRPFLILVGVYVGFFLLKKLIPFLGRIWRFFQHGTGGPHV